MPQSLLATKLYLPTSAPNLVKRRRLTERLVAGLQRPLTLVSAPAGFGKTTLLSDWKSSVEGQEYSTAWLSLDQGDNDPGRFWAYVLAALRTLPELAGLPDELDAGAPLELLLAPLINGLETATGPVALVLDDYHNIEAPDIHTPISFLAEHMPASLRLVVLTRSDPPWPMARLRAHGLMSELRAMDLRFTPEEATEFLTCTMGLDLSAADVSTVEQRTEGWIAALQMVAISLDGHPDPHGFVTAFSGENRHIADYLAEEVLARQPESLRRFLLQTSVLERLSAPVCSAVTGYPVPDSRGLLETIERRGLFLVPLDPMRQWFRFHHLFKDLLQAHLQHTEPDLVPILNSRAADWYGANDFTMEAANHCLAARDFDRTIALIEQHVGGWWAMASPAFFDLMAKLPPEVLRRSPGFCVGQAWMNCVFGQIDQATALIDAALRQAPLVSDVQSFLALLQTYIAEFFGRPYTITEALLHAPDSISEQTGTAMRNGADVMLSYLLYMDGRLNRAAALLAQTAERDLTHRATNAIPSAISRLVRMRLIEGRVSEAADICHRYLAVTQERGESRFFVCGNLHAALADVLRLQGDLEGAEAQALEGVRLNQAWNVPHATSAAAQALAHVRLAQGAAGEALALLEEEQAVTRGRTLPPDLISERVALRVEAWLAVGNLEAAEHWARESGLSANDPLSFRKELGHIGLARVALASGCEAEGLALLSRLDRAAEAGGRLGRLSEIRSLSRQVKASRSELLSERETEIVRLIAEGRSNQEIARTLVLAVGTVKVHVHNLFQKLGVQSRTQAVSRARDLRLLK